MTSLAMDRRSWAARLRLPRTTRRTFSERAAFLAFIAPNFMLFGVFTFYPLLYNLYLSFTKWNMVSPVIPFVGVGNYVTLVHDAVFWKVLKNTFFLGIGSIAIRLVLALLLALVLNQRLTGRSLYRAVIFSPTFTTGAAIAIVWTWFLHKQFGLVRLPFDWIGLSSPNWLADVRWTLPAITLDQISAVRSAARATTRDCLTQRKTSGSRFRTRKEEGGERFPALRLPSVEGALLRYILGEPRLEFCCDGALAGPDSSNPYVRVWP